MPTAARIATQRAGSVASLTMSGSLEIPASHEAREAFACAVERDPMHPERVIAVDGMPQEVRAEVALLLAAYARGLAIERALCASNCAIDRVIAEVARSRSEPVDRSIPERIGSYGIERVLSSTERSAVLRAQQERPIQREVALKLLFEDAADPDIAARVELERQILAALEHPNIARIYDFGIDERKRPYIVMESVRDGTITEWCAARAAAAPNGGDARLSIFLQVVEAVRYAHARGVLHCDLKPANILIQELEGAPYAKVIDFGIARAFGGALAERAALIDLSQSVGTLLSMSPEALTPGGADLDVRTDVYGLGLVLFELLAGRPPRTAREGDLAGTVRDLLERPLPRLRSVWQESPPDLDAIVAKACATRPDDRYESVAALGADIEAYLAGREVSARRRGVVERARRALGRRWKAAAVAGCALAAAFVWVEAVTGPVRTRAHEQLERARDSIAAASALRNVAGRTAEREARAIDALDATRAALDLAGASEEAIELRAAALEEAILPRLVRDDHKSSETVRLVNELVGIREAAVKASGDARSLERLSIALAYQLDTVRGTDAYDAIEARQLAIDEELYARDPNSRLYADNLCWSYQRVYAPMWGRGESERVLGLLRRSSEIAEANLARHGPSVLTLHTAVSAALYEMFAARIDGRALDDLRATAARARAHAEALLRLQPDHAEGASFGLEATTIEADELIDHGMPEEAVRVLQQARAVAEPAIAREIEFGHLGLRVIWSWQSEALAWLAAGDATRAEAAVERFSEEIDRRRDHLRRTAKLGPLLSSRDLLRIRIALLRGEIAQARAALPAMLGGMQRDLRAEGEFALDPLALHLAEHLRHARSSPEVKDFLREIAQSIDAELARSELTEDGRRVPRLSRLALEIVLDRGADLRQIATDIRKEAARNLMGEADLQRLERMAGLRTRG